MAKMLNGTHSWIAFDTSSFVGAMYYKYYLIKAIEAPESLPIAAIKSIGWITIKRLLKKERVFIDLHNRIYSPSLKKYLTILQARIMIDPTLTQKMNVNHELIEGFPSLSPINQIRHKQTIDGNLGLQALGR